MSQFVLSFRAVLESDDETTAHLFSNNLIEHVTPLLDEGDSFECLQVLNFDESSNIQPEELIARLTRTRNDLIRTRLVTCWNLAKELDKTIHALRFHYDIDKAEVMPTYDHTEFLEVSRRILQHNENPL